MFILDQGEGNLHYWVFLGIDKELSKVCYMKKKKNRDIIYNDRLKFLSY